ncbi:probable disease resistance protein At1g61180 [Eutrema salsugineum]|uniref:probable disease resistance protein At1g61180 n=1 Tax=Eutrema salsugineum TaxID=72664 RepID=UPI000CED7B4E|nr:probable disease resistance protein At1g61180 [Eutrema salsugineum]
MLDCSIIIDIVREMALWIASDFGKPKEICVVQARVGLRETPKVEDWRPVRILSLMCNAIEEISCCSKCSELTTMFFQDNKLKSLSKQISELTSLQYLDLSNTSIEQLPVGFQELKKLIQLNLTSTHRLRSISEISKVSSLRILKLLKSNVHGDVSSVKELQILEHLQVLTITISTELGLEQILGDQKLANCINGLCIQSFYKKPLNMSLLVSMKNLRMLWLENSHISEINTKCREGGTDLSDLDNPTSPCFTNLLFVHIYGCIGFKDMTWLLFAPNLVYLQIEYSNEVEEIINKEKANNLTGITPFQKLEFLSLTSLPKLESIYWSPLPFPSLWHTSVLECPNLRKLPFDATSVPRLARFTIDMGHGQEITELEWEDEDTKNRLLPLIHLVSLKYSPLLD